MELILKLNSGSSNHVEIWVETHEVYLDMKTLVAVVHIDDLFGNSKGKYNVWAVRNMLLKQGQLKAKLTIEEE